MKGAAGSRNAGQDTPARRLGLRGYLGDESGLVLVAAMLAVAALFALVTSVSSLASSETRSTPYWRDKSEAYYVAESGLNHAMWKLKYEENQVVEGVYGETGPSFTSDNTDESAGVLPPGSWYEVWIQTDPVNPVFKHATVVGHVGEQSYLMRGLLQEDGPFDNGPEGAGNKNEVVLPDTWDDDITVTSSDVELTKEIYFVKTVRCEGEAALKIAPGLNVVYVFVHETLYAGGGGVVNPDGASENGPKLVFIMIPDPGVRQSATVAGGTTFNAFIWANDARVKITGNSTVVYGAIAGTDVSVKGAAIIGDPAAGSITWPDPVMAEHWLIGVD